MFSCNTRNYIRNEITIIVKKVINEIMKKSDKNNYKKIEKKNNDVDTDVAQHERNRINRYTTAFSNI